MRGKAEKIKANIEIKTQRRPKEPNVFEDRIYIIDGYLIHGSLLNGLKRHYLNSESTCT